MHNNILQINNNFANLVHITDENELQFEFVYKVSQVKVIQENAYSVGITIKTKNKIQTVIVPSSKNGRLDASRLIQNIVNYRPTINRINTQEKETVVAYKQGDITSKINNHILAYIKSNLPLDNVGFQKTKIIVSKVEEKNESQTSSITTQTIGHSTFVDTNLNVKTDSNINAQNARLNLLKKSLHPSIVTDCTNRSISTYDNLSGLIRKNSYPEYIGSPLTSLINSYLFQGQITKNDQQYVTTVGQTFDDIITIKTKVSIKDKGYDILNIRFELLQPSSDNDKKSSVATTSNNLLPLEIIEKDLNIPEHIKNYFSSMTAPSVFAAKTNSGITLQIKQNDDRSSGIHIFKRSLSISNNIVNTTYQQIGQANLSKSGGIGNYKYINLNDESAIYRVIAYSLHSKNLVPLSFSDVVVTNTNVKFTKKMIIVPFLSEQGIQVTAYNTFPDVVAARLLIRNVTKKQKAYNSVGDVFSFSSKDMSSTLNIVRNLIPYHIYELTTKIIEKNGIETLSSYSTLFEYVPYVGNPFDISIVETKSAADVQFSVNANLIKDQVGMLGQLLSQTSSNYDLNELYSRTANYDKFIAFNVVRYNISTGDVENMGILANKDAFIDSNVAKLHSSKPINNSVYKYVIYPLIRDPHTVISQKQERKDVETRKSYNINPRKHLHPLTLTRGNIISNDVIKNDLDPKDDLLYGLIGISYQVNASFVMSKPLITNFNASLISNKKVSLKWKLEGDKSTIDHIIILREIDGIRKIISKAHCLLNDNSFNIDYELTLHDIGNVKFILIPIYNDFSSGSVSISNELLVHSVE